MHRDTLELRRRVADLEERLDALGNTISRLGPARTYRTESQLSNAVGQYGTWHDLATANFPAYPDQPDEAPADHRTLSPRRRVSAGSGRPGAERRTFDDRRRGAGRHGDTGRDAKRGAGCPASTRTGETRTVVGGTDGQQTRPAARRSAADHTAVVLCRRPVGGAQAGLRAGQGAGRGDEFLDAFRSGHGHDVQGASGLGESWCRGWRDDPGRRVGGHADE